MVGGTAAVACQPLALGYAVMNGDDDADGTRWAEVLAKATAMLALQGAKISQRLDPNQALSGFIDPPGRDWSAGRDPGRGLAAQTCSA